jgi:5,10-methylene-tetrahydrofolate dehydrogenase/methenyl tetrahydrofolate cyclohydrolase
MQIDGRQLAQNILSQLHIRVEKLQQQKHIQPHLGIIVEVMIRQQFHISNKRKKWENK